MATTFEPPPTYADPVLVNQVTGKSQFNPIWLSWFLRLSQSLGALGSTGAAVTAPTGNGLMVHQGSGATIVRNLVAGDSYLGVADGDGLAGNPSLTLDIDAVAEGIDLANQYATRYDADAAVPTYAYFGQAVAGTGEGSALWRIQKLVYGTDSDVTITWADGNKNFDNVWTNRASLSYS